MNIHYVVRKLSLPVAIASVLFLAACGTGGGGKFNPTTNFSKSSLNGSFAYQLSGADENGSFRELGVFTADGNGKITAGKDDFTQNTTVASSTSTGTYQVLNDGTGSMTLNLSNGRSVLLAITMVSTSKVYLVVAQENSILITGAGVALKQDASAFTNPPTGTFVIRQHDLNIVQGTSAARVGAITVAAGTVTGNEDVNRAGTVSSDTLTGLFNFPDGSGRGTGSFTDAAGTSTFFFYVVDANRFFLLSTNNGIVGTGQGEKQSGAPFSTASFTGSFAFGSQGDTALNFAGVNTVGRFTADGAGNITDGALDTVQDGTSSSNVSFTGTYTVTSNAGRVAVTLTSGNSLSQILWMVSPSRAFSLTNSASKQEDGTLDLQQTTAFSNSTFNAQYAFVMDGFDTVQFHTYDRVGTIISDGAGNSSLAEFINLDGINNTSGSLPGSYSVSANGRATMGVSALSNNLVLYFISANDAYMLQNDTGIAIAGAMSKQIEP